MNPRHIDWADQVAQHYGWWERGVFTSKVEATEALHKATGRAYETCRTALHRYRPGKQIRPYEKKVESCPHCLQAIAALQHLSNCPINRIHNTPVNAKG